MVTYKIVDYDRLVLGSVKLDAYGSLKIRECQYRSRDTNNKMAILAINHHGRGFISDPNCIIRFNASTCISTSQTIYVAKEVKTSRDLFRNAGYKIVLDKEKADKIVLPDPNPNNLKFEHALAFLWTDNLEGGLKKLVLYGVADDVKDEQYDTIVQMISRKLGAHGSNTVEILYDSIKRKSVCEIFQKCESYQIIFDNPQKYRYKCILETNVKIDYPITICPETLSTWKRATNDLILSKSICQSDWKDYPFTMLCLLMTYHSDIYRIGGNNMRLVVEQIGLPTDGCYHSIEGELKDRVVDPKDWNMLQDWLMYELNLPDNGGYVDKKRVEDLKALSSFIRARFVAAPMKIDVPLSAKMIRSMLNN